MKYQAFLHHFVSMGGWLEGSWCVCVCGHLLVGGGVGSVVGGVWLGCWGGLCSGCCVCGWGGGMSCVCGWCVCGGVGGGVCW